MSVRATDITELAPIYRISKYLAKIIGQDVEIPAPIYRKEFYLAKICGETVTLPEPISRVDHYLARLAGLDVEIPTPRKDSRVEQYLAKICGEDIETPAPISRTDHYLAQWAEGGGYEETTVTGVSPLLLAAAAARAIVSLTQYGKCEQDETPTPAAPVDIVCNNGTLKMVDDELPAEYKRVLGFAMNNNSFWEIADFPLYGSDTLRFAFEATDACNVIGAYSGSASGNNYSLYVGSSSNYLRYKSGAYNSAVDFSTRYDVEITPTGSHGMKVNSTWTEQTFVTPTNLCIGTTATSASSAKLKGNLYGNVEVVGRLKLIPCERVSDNVLGYYDTIGKAFYEQNASYDGAVSLGYDGSHYHLAVVGTDEMLSIAPIGSATQNGIPAPDNYVPIIGTECGDTTLYAIDEDEDTIAVDTQTITRVVDKHIFDGTETFSKSTAYGKAFLVNAASSAWSADRSKAVLCTHFLGLPQTSSTQEDYTCFFNLTGHFYFRVPDNDDATAFKAWLAEQYAAGTPVVVYFVRSSPTTEAYTGTPVGQTASAPNLFAVGDYADEAEIISGGVKRKVGIKILTGEETGWALSDSGTTHRFRGVKPSDCYTPASRAPSVCTHFKYVSTGSAVGGMFIGASQYWYFIPTDQTIDTVDEWTAWLKEQYAAGTPVIVLYPLKEETQETITPQPLSTTDGDNVVTVTANVDNIQLEITYAKKKGA